MLWLIWIYFPLSPLLLHFDGAAQIFNCWKGGVRAGRARAQKHQEKRWLLWHRKRGLKTASRIEQKSCHRNKNMIPCKTAEFTWWCADIYSPQGCFHSYGSSLSPIQLAATRVGSGDSVQRKTTHKGISAFQQGLQSQLSDVSDFTDGIYEFKNVYKASTSSPSRSL